MPCLPRLESRLRTIKFAHYLQKAGYEVTIFASSIMHNMDIDLIEDDSLYIERQYGDLNFVHIKTAKYKGNGLKRVIGLIQFPRRFLKLLENFRLRTVLSKRRQYLSEISFIGMLEK